MPKITAKDLSKLWGAPDHSRLTKKQQSIRLPILVAAKIEAIQELYPTQKKSEIIGQLLASALDQFEQGLESLPDLDQPTVFGPDEETFFPDIGDKGKFIRLSNEHIKTFELELGNGSPTLLNESYVRDETR